MPEVYDHKHKAERARLDPVVQAGQSDCAEPICLVEQEGGSRWIAPGTPWQLSHDHVNGGYLGPSHAACNGSEGGKRNKRPTTHWNL